MPLDPVRDPDRPDVVFRPAEVGLTEQLSAEPLAVPIWDDGDSVHLRGVPQHVEGVEGMVRPAVDYVASRWR